jgi:hypothetical protein
MKTITDTYTVKLSGQQMLDMGWEIGNDSPEYQYELSIDTDNEKITAAILCSNNEYSDSGFSFDFADTFNDLRFAGHIRTMTQDLNISGEWFSQEKFNGIQKYSV